MGFLHTLYVVTRLLCLFILFFIEIARTSVHIETVYRYSINIIFF